MDNKELEKNFNEILDEQNFFDMLLKAKNFEKEYKGSAFYKETKLDLYQALKMFKAYDAFNLKRLFTQLQKQINNLDFTSFENILQQFTTAFETENEETLNIINNFKETIQ